MNVPPHDGHDPDPASASASAPGSVESTTGPPPADGDPADDPVWRHGRREAVLMLVVFAVFLAWNVGVSYGLGYGEDARVEPILGLPAWVFWGVALPWVVGATITVAIALFVIRDDPLGEAGDEYHPPDADAPQTSSSKRMPENEQE